YNSTLSFFFTSRRRHTRFSRDWSSDVCSSDLGIMHQINLERMSPVVHNRDGVAFPDTLVGTDSHTPHVDALGVIAIGVGGLEAEIGRASCRERVEGHEDDMGY